jgi:hypothetical protein
VVWEKTQSGFWNFSLKIGAPSSMTTRFPFRIMLVMLIVMGSLDAPAPAAGFGAAAASGVAAAFMQGAATGVALGVVLHSRIDLAGTTGAAAGVAFGVVRHSRIDVAGGVAVAGSSATTVGNVVAASTAAPRHVSILVLSIARPSQRFPLKYGRRRDAA